MVRATSVTVGLPVRSLQDAQAWYERALQLDPPELEPTEGVVEYDLGGVWLQLGEEDGGQGMAALRIGVPDVRAERERLIGLGVEVEELVQVPDAVEFFDFAGPDGNQLSFYTETGN